MDGQRETIDERTQDQWMANAKPLTGGCEAGGGPLLVCSPLRQKLGAAGAGFREKALSLQGI